MTRDELLHLIAQGEGQWLEFKMEDRYATR